MAQQGPQYYVEGRMVLDNTASIALLRIITGMPGPEFSFSFEKPTPYVDIALKCLVIDMTDFNIVGGEEDEQGRTLPRIEFTFRGLADPEVTEHAD